MAKTPSSSPSPPAIEADPRFPSGPWLGFFLQPELFDGRVPMELILRFAQGTVEGDGLDPIGEFRIRGSYDTDSGEVTMHKRYLGRHSVFYRGFNEGKGIWGVWEIAALGFRGGFHIWPEGMPDPTTPRLREQVDLPADAGHVEQPVGV